MQLASLCQRITPSLLAIRQMTDLQLSTPTVVSLYDPLEFWGGRGGGGTLGGVQNIPFLSTARGYAATCGERHDMARDGDLWMRGLAVSSAMQ